MTESPRPLKELARKCGVQWRSIEAAKAETQERRKELSDILGADPPVGSEDRSVVVFGSIAREEVTDESDLDWTLLVDGQAVPEHLQIAQEIDKRFDAGGFKKPGRTGIFGNMSFSHDIIHRIGGEGDTNRNLTQRMLLLLESFPVSNERAAYDRVVTGILHRYILEDAGLTYPGAQGNLPRFLLNDIARFWRTMAVDFANKQRERAGEGWGIRNAKLRFSRKLIFASGLLLCYRCVLDPRIVAPKSSGADAHKILELLKEYIRLTPLENLADAVVRFGSNLEFAKRFFDGYDRFLQTLSDSAKRKELNDLKPGDAATNKLFQEMRQLSHEFQEGLDGLFLGEDAIGGLTRKYGVF